METRSYKVNLRNNYYNALSVGLSQYDTGVQLEFDVYDGEEKAVFNEGTTAKIQGVRPSGVGFDVACTLSGNVASVSTTTDMTGEYGEFPVELRFYENGLGVDVGTVNFIFTIEKAAHPDGTIDADIAKQATFVERLEALEENTVTDPTLSIAGRPADAAATGIAVDSVYSDKALIDIPLAASSTGYRLKSNGGCAKNTAYILDKYTVHAGDLLYLDITRDETATVETDTGAFQFQVGASVPYDPNSNLVAAHPYSYKGYIVVPDRATYLIVGRTEATTNTVKRFLRQNDMFICLGGAGTGYLRIKGNTIATNASIYFYPYPYNGEYYNLNFNGVAFEKTCTANKTLCIDLSKLGHNTLGDSTTAADAFVEVDYGNIPAGHMPIMQYRSSNGGTFLFSPWTPFVYEETATKYSVVDPEIAKTNLIAHRGGNTKQENTKANFEDAIANGYKILECDIRMTSDTVPILSHDPTFVIGGTTYTIAEMTAAEIIAVDPSKMLLSDFLLLCKRKNVAAELDCATISNNAHIQIIEAMVTQYGANGKCYYAVQPAQARAILAQNKNNIISVAGMISTTAVDGIADIIKAANLCICSTRGDYITQDLINYIHNAGCVSKTYTIDSATDIETYLNYGVDLIITNSILPSAL